MGQSEHIDCPAKGIAAPSQVRCLRLTYSLNQLRKAYRCLYLSDLNTTQAVERIRAELPANDEITRLVEFIEGSTRGIIK